MASRPLRHRFDRPHHVHGRQGVLDRPSRIVPSQKSYAGYRLRENADEFMLSTPALTVSVNKSIGALRYFDAAGKLLMREPEAWRKVADFEGYYRNIFTRDSVYRDRAEHRRSARHCCRVTRPSSIAMPLRRSSNLSSAEDEALFGLGSHEEGYGNLRGKSRELYQQNMKAVVPLLRLDARLQRAARLLFADDLS